jgi:hypothetical protein
MKSFAQFIKLKEEEKPNHIGSLEDELGINPEDFEKVPQMGANFNLGGTSFNASPYKILGYNKDVTGKIVSARIQLVNDVANKTRKQVRDGERIPDHDVNQVFVIPIEKLNGFISNGLSPAGGGDMGGGMGGMPV